MEAIIRGDYRFEPGAIMLLIPNLPHDSDSLSLFLAVHPEEYWANVSGTARDFVRECLTIDPTSRPTAVEALKHKWLASEEPHFVTSPTGGPTNLLPQIQKAFDARKTFRKAVFSMIATKRMSVLAGLSPTAQTFGHNIAQLKEESEKEVIDGVRIPFSASPLTSPRIPSPRR